MSNEEAIANLNMISVAFVEPVTKEQRKLIDDTFDMAIQALEQNESAEEWYKLFVEKLEQEPETGHWSRKTKVDAYDIAGVKTWGIKCQCDRCCFTTIVVEDFGYYKYCPNCGARMESEEV